MNELNSEITVATAMVMPNWRKNCPDRPGTKAVGTKTEASTSAIATNAPPTSRIVSRVASFGAFAFRQMPFDVLDHDDGVVHDHPDGEHQAEQAEVVDGEPEGCHDGHRADQRDRDGQDRDDRRTPSLQEDDHDEDHEHHGLVDGLHQFVDAVGDEAGRVVADFVRDALREILAEVGHGPGDLVLGRKSVRAGRCSTASATAGLSPR